MFIDVIRVKSYRSKRELILRCDTCNVTFQKSFKSSLMNALRHYCCKKCSDVSRRVGGSSHDLNKVMSRIARTKQTLVKRYGSDNPTMVKEFLEKRKKTWLQNYGVEHPFQSESVKLRQQETMFQRYGVVSAMHNHDSVVKRHKTLKLNGWYAQHRSTSEDEFFQLLSLKFGSENVKRHVTVHSWSIDFYVDSVDVYVQFDGVYWHGLDRSIEIIQEFKHPQDATIHKTILRDRQQDHWFAEHGMRLIRITDKEFKDDPEACIFKIREVDQRETSPI